MKIQPVNNEKGIALVTALMLTLIALAIIGALLYLVLQGTRTSAASKTYRTSLEASYGGVEFLAKDLVPAIFANSSSAANYTTLQNRFSAVNLLFASSMSCINQKMTLPNSKWTSCNAAQKSINLSDVKAAPDITFSLSGIAGQSNFKVYSKIVNTTPGNTDPAANTGAAYGDTGGLIVAAGTAYDSSDSGGVKVKHIPALYQIEVQGERETNPQEKAQLSVLYAY